MRFRSDFGVVLGDDVNEFFVVDSSISVLVGIVDHLVDFSGWEVLTDWGGNLLEFFGAESSLFVDVEIFEELSQRGLWGSVSTESEDVEESCEVHIVSVRAGVDNAQNLGGLAFDAEGSDGVDEFLGWDVSRSVVVEDVETFLQLGNGISVKVLGSVFAGVKSLK
jgi:hypothetical protein